MCIYQYKCMCKGVMYRHWLWIFSSNSLCITFWDSVPQWIWRSPMPLYDLWVLGTWFLCLSHCNVPNEQDHTIFIGFWISKCGLQVLLQKLSDWSISAVCKINKNKWPENVSAWGKFSIISSVRNKTQAQACMQSWISSGNVYNIRKWSGTNLNEEGLRNSKLTLKNTVALYQHDEQLLSSQHQGSYRDCLETIAAIALYGTLAKEWK